MGLRETINQKPAIAGGVVAALCLTAAVIAGFNMVGDDGRGRFSRMFITTDDGKTYTTADSSKIPPFEVGGSEAVIAYVYECDGKPFVGYLSKYTPAAKTRIEALQKERGAKVINAVDPGSLDPTEVMFKKPGEGEWVTGYDPKGRDTAILSVRCPGNGQIPKAVDP